MCGVEAVVVVGAHGVVEAHREAPIVPRASVLCLCAYVKFGSWGGGGGSLKEGGGGGLV